MTGLICTTCVLIGLVWLEVAIAKFIINRRIGR